MAVIRLNVSALTGRAYLHGDGGQADTALAEVLHVQASDHAPIVIMIHGFKYDPTSPQHCPQRLIFDARHPHSWPAGLGITAGSDTLGVTFGWHARGRVRQVFRAASAQGAELVRLIGLMKQLAPTRPVHIIAHSMGAEVALAALQDAPAHSIARLILLAGAARQGRAERALKSRAGRTAEVINVVSRKNRLFDVLFEWMVPAPRVQGRALGRGISGHNALNLQLDCPGTLRAISMLGVELALSGHPVCHWSAYTARGALPFYSRLIHDADRLSLSVLRHTLSAAPTRTGETDSRPTLGKLLRTCIMRASPRGATSYEPAN